jgi:hypothetical protein
MEVAQMPNPGGTSITVGGGTFNWATTQTLKDFGIPLPSGTSTNPNTPVDNFQANSALMGSIIMMSDDNSKGASPLLISSGPFTGYLKASINPIIGASGNNLVSTNIFQSAEKNYTSEANNFPSGSIQQQRAEIEANDLKSAADILNGEPPPGVSVSGTLPKYPGVVLNNDGNGKGRLWTLTNNPPQ